MFKKTVKVTNDSQREKAVARYMQEVNDIQKAGIGGLAAIGGRHFLPNLAVAADEGLISPPCRKP